MQAFKLNPNLQKALQDLGFLEATPIQKAFVPAGLAGKDLIGIAQTGTGKTAAYLLPILMRLRSHEAKIFPRALVLVPTKELVLQVEKHAKDLAIYTDLKIAGIFGGVGVQEQKKTVEQGIDLLIATPGRFLEIYGLKAFSPRKIQVLVLDEADRMLDIHFRQQLYDILEILPTKRQNFLLSATYPEKMAQITQDFLDFPEKIEITPQATAAANVSQFVYDLPNLLSKVYFLERLLKDETLQRVLIFVRSKESADQIFKFIGRKTTRKVGVLHGNKGQHARLEALEAFRLDPYGVLVSTDVAARGLDISEISHVINFEIPLNYLEYIHRIGRTGRAFHKGIAINFANKAEKMHLQRIQKIMGKKITPLELPADFEIVQSEKKEIIQIEKEIDLLKQRENPDYKGAFHAKKKKKDSSERFRGAVKKLDRRG